MIKLFSSASLYLSISVLGGLLLGIIALFIGIEYTDTGFVIGLAYRISLGQHIYFDFDYVRPPLTPLLWSLPLNLDLEGKEILIRFLVLIQKMVTAAFLYLTLRKCGQNKVSSISVATIAFSFLVHNMPMMPWHTTDGLFFAATAIGLFAWNAPVAGLIFATMAALTKQSFYPLPILFFISSILYFPNRRLALTLTIFLIAIGISLNPYFLKFTEIAVETISLEDLFLSAILPHFKLSNWNSLFYGLMLSTLVILKKRSLPSLFVISIFFPLLNLSYSVIYEFINFGKANFPTASYGVTHVAMTFSILHFLTIISKEKLAAFTNIKLHISILLLSAAWMSTISWGYANYLFSYGFLIAANLLLVIDEQRLQANIFAILAILSILVFIILRLTAPYRMDSPFLTKHVMVQDGHYRYIWASVVDFEKLKSIERLSKSMGCKDTFPSVPQSALIGNYSPPLRADWKMDVEFPSHKEAQLELFQQNCKLFVEKDKRVIGWQDKFKSSAINLDEHSHCAREFDKNFYIIDFSICKTH